MPLVIQLLLMAAGGHAGEALSGLLGRMFVGGAGKAAAAAAERAMAGKAIGKLATATAAARSALPTAIRAHVPETLGAATRGLGRWTGSALLGGAGGMAGYQLGQYLTEPQAQYQPHGAEALLGTPVHETGNDLGGLVSALESKLNSQSTNDDGEMDPQLEKLLAALNQQQGALV